MSRSAVFVVLVIGAGLIGCATPRYRWVHPDKTEEQLHEDRLQCDTEVRSEEATPVFDGERATTMRECLYGKGWRQEPIQ